MRGRTCTKCLTPKRAGDFEKNGKHPDGTIRLRSVCKACGSRYKLARTDDRICTKCHVPKKSDEFQGRNSHCRNCRNLASYAYKKGPGKTAHNARVAERFRRLYKTDPTFRQKHGARQAALLAVKVGILKRPKVCPECGRKVRLHAHHHKGYAKKNWLNVVWLCPRCHYKKDNP